jgi:hypothetical protein
LLVWVVGDPSARSRRRIYRGIENENRRGYRSGSVSTVASNDGVMRSRWVARHACMGWFGWRAGDSCARAVPRFRNSAD